MLVQSDERWGNDTHQCRLGLGSPKVQKLLEYLETSRRQAHGEISRGVFTFSFGGRNEPINVTIKKLKPEEKSDPPEAPNATKHGI